MNKLNKFESQMLYRLLLNRRAYEKSSDGGLAWVPLIVAVALGLAILVIAVGTAIRIMNNGGEIKYKSEGTEIEIQCYKEDCSSGAVPVPEPISIFGTALAGGSLAYFKMRRSLKKGG